MAIASVNCEVQQELTQGKTKLRGQYNKYTDQERAEIACYAVRNGVKSASVKFSRQYSQKINESTIRKFVKVYRAEVTRMNDRFITACDSIAIEETGTSSAFRKN